MKQNLFLVCIMSVFILVANITSASVDNKAESETGLEILDVWARVSKCSQNNNSAAYMTIKNTTKQDIIIIGASAPEIANNVELHKSFVDEKGISRMVAMEKIVIPAETQIELKPGAIHIMLLDLKTNLLPDNKFTINIEIEGTKTISVESIVRKK